MTKLQANKELLKLLTELIEANPDLRLGQILQVYQFVRPEQATKPELCINWQNEFYTESEVILRRVLQTIKNLK